MKVIGFDFGTTNSLVSVVSGDRTVNYLDEDRPIPSVVCYEGASTIVGGRAKERLAQAGLGIQRNVIRSPKMYLGRDSVFIAGVERSPVDIVADVVRHVLAKAGIGLRAIGSVSGAVVTIPVDMNGSRRRALRQAFLQADLRIVQFVHEPLAALYGLFRTRDLSAMARRYEGKLILVFDWGGGTLDLTLCRPTGGMVVQIRNDGTEEVGGDVFDETLKNYIVQKVSEARGLEALEAQSGAPERLIDSCERAKIDLSSRPSAQLYVSSFFRGLDEDDLDYRLGRDELERVVTPLLDKGFRRISKLLDDAGFSPEQVALCVATGGMSNMPPVRRRLHELFGPERVEIPDGTATLIAEGAAWIASDKARLHLAKNVELELARSSYLPLVKAGTAMPRAGEVQESQFHLYCTDPRDGVAKFQFCSPSRAGEHVRPNEPRTNLEIATISVDRMARPFQERLELDIQIDEDLILSAYARSLNAQDQDQREIHDLEFGLALPTAAPATDAGDPEHESPGSTTRGALTIRANVSSTDDKYFVPGELLYRYEPDYFARSQRPPDEQVSERLFYEPCAGCGRASNDPLCFCDPAVARRARGAPATTARHPNG